MEFARIARAVRRWRERNRAREALQCLSDRELADIGLTRDGIESALRGDPAHARRIRPLRGS